MSIRIKLITSYLAMLIIPCLLFVISFLMIAGIFFAGNLAQMTGQEQTDQINQNSLFASKLSALQDTTALDVFLNRDCKNYKVVVITQGGSVYTSPKADPEFVRAAANIALKNNLNNSDAEILAQQFFYKTQAMLKNGEQLLVISEYLPNIMQENSYAQTLLPIFVLVVLAIIVVTSGSLTYFVSKSILRPLRQLKMAMQEIREGNLDYELDTTRKDELGELMKVFEEMRLRLKSSVRERILDEERRKQFMSNISHDLRTPITSIVGYSQGLLDGVANTDEKKIKYITTINTKATEMQQLVSDLFMYSKLDAGSTAFRWEIVDLCPFVAQYIEEIREECAQSNMSITCAAPDTPLLIRADRDKMRRVLGNIISNAVKYKSPGQGKINVNMKAQADWAILEIRDNGIGIAQKDINRIFDRFYRSDPSRWDSSKGSGLGLSIVKQIVESHNGKVSAASRPSVMTLITVMLPLAQSSGAAQKTRPKPSN